MTYDPKREVVVMFGGDGRINQLYDTWEYDGVDWRQVNLNPFPEFIRFPVLTYYAPWGKVILFGEYRDLATYQTWVYDGASWENLNQDLPVIRTPSMLFQTVYDSCRQKIILQMTGNWTYEFDGYTWQVTVKGDEPFLPIPVANLVYDTRRNLVVLFGLPLPIDWRSETWEFDGTEWKQAHPLVSPPPRISHAMVFDEERGVTVMFGGFSEDGTYLNDIWEYDGTTWVQR
jgi:hypothetical protein